MSEKMNQAYVAELGMSAEQAAIVAGELTLREAVQKLADHEEHQPALSLLARHMAKPYAIGWAAACMKTVGVAKEDADAVACVDEWLAGQDEAVRRRAARLAAERDYATAGAWLAAATGWTSGSLAPDGEAEVPPPDYLYALASAGAVGMTIAEDPESFEARFAEWVARALEIVES